METHRNLEAVLQNIVNSLSLYAAIATCIILVGLGLFKYHLIDRVSLRIQGIIALIDIARHLTLIQATYSNEVVCQFIAFSVHYTEHVYLLLNIAIALNIQYIVIQHKRPSEKLQWIYGSISVALPAIITVIPLVFGRYGLNRNNRCRLIDDESTKWWNLLLMHSTKIPGTIYCLVISIIVMLKIHRHKEQLVLIRGSEINYGPNPLEYLWTLYSRICLYPLSCFITLFPVTFAMLVLDITGSVPRPLTFIFRTCQRITGTLNFITLISDPHCQIAIKFLLRSLSSLKVFRDNNIDLRVPSSQAEINLSTPYHHVLEYPNGDRIPMRDYIRLL